MLFNDMVSVLMLSFRRLELSPHAASGALLQGAVTNLLQAS